MNSLDHYERDEDGLIKINLPMDVEGRRVRDATGVHLFTAATEEIADALVEALNLALDICINHNGSNIHSVNERKGTIGILN